MERPHFFFMKRQLFNLIILISILATLPLTILAAELEQRYPEIPGVSSFWENYLSINQITTSKASVIGLIKYFSTWAIIIAGVVAFGTLAFAGIQYLTSSGNFSRARAAKSRFSNALLGLLILIGSFVILVSINPQLTVLKVNKVPVSIGIILFTKDGYNNFKDNVVGKEGKGWDIKDLINQGQAFVLKNDVPDLTKDKQFGDLVVTSRQIGNLVVGQSTAPAKTVDFEKFHLYAIGFWGDLEKDAQVMFYPQPNFDLDKAKVMASDVSQYIDIKEPIIYTSEGRLKSDGSLDTSFAVGSFEYGMKIMFLENNTVKSNEWFQSVVTYLNLNPSGDEAEKAKLQNNEARQNSYLATSVYHPLLSIKLKHNAPGVYLYSPSGEERFLDTSVNDLKEPDFNFDKKAETIKIVNDKRIKVKDPLTGVNEWKTVESHNYLAILHEKDFFTGALRIFFGTSTDETKHIPAYCSNGLPLLKSPNFGDCGQPSGTVSEQEFNNLVGFKYFGDIDTAMGTKKIEVGNIAINHDTGLATAKKIVGEQDVYGAMDYVSSAHIFEFNPDFSACEEVRLCTRPDFGGDCLVYTRKEGNFQLSSTGEATVKFPMPLYVPVNIPEKAKVLAKIEGEGVNKKVSFREQKFADNIRSIYVQPEGICAVVLFENAVDYKPQAQLGNPSVFSGWKNGGPGTRSEVFIQSEPELKGHPISSCGGIAGTNILTTYKSCASAIAVFSIQKQQVEPKTRRIIATPEYAPVSSESKAFYFGISAYTDSGATCCGKTTEWGVVAVDKKYIPLGSTIKIPSPDVSANYSQNAKCAWNYLKNQRGISWPSSFKAVDTGCAICADVTGRGVDLWLPYGSDLIDGCGQRHSVASLWGVQSNAVEIIDKSQTTCPNTQSPCAQPEFCSSPYCQNARKDVGIK